MANHVRNRIRLIGNDSIKKLSIEINRRFNADYKSHKNKKENSSIGRVLYGLTDQGVELSAAVLGAQWAYVDCPLEKDEDLSIISAWVPISKVQDHILEYAAKLDPNVVVINEYNDENPNFYGCRVVALVNNNIVESHDEEDTSNLTVMYEDEMDDSDDDCLSWEKLWGNLKSMKSELIKGLLETAPRIDNKELNQYLD